MKTGFFCGVFDFLHYGHILAFEECKRNCERLIVAVNSAENIDSLINPCKEPPLFPIDHRVEILKACRLVDEVVVYNSEDQLLNILRTQKYDIRFLGDDYLGKPITGENLTAEVHYISRGHGWSSSYFKKKLQEGKK